VKFFSQLIQRLRQDISYFEDVTLWHDPSSAQSFIVNASLFRVIYEDLLQRRCRPCSERSWTTFILLNDPPTLLQQAPENILPILEDIYIRILGNPTSLVSSQELTQEHMIPIAAILLEYPAAYVPTSIDQTEFLRMELLTVYEGNIIHANTENSKHHTLLKFSCPNVIGSENIELSPQRLIDRMKARFVPRLQKIDDKLSMGIRFFTERHDRLAL